MFQEFFNAFVKEAAKAKLENQTQQALFAAQQEAQAIWRNPYLSRWQKERHLQEPNNCLQAYTHQQDVRKQFVDFLEHMMRHS